jgi:hypothetical protein
MKSVKTTGLTGVLIFLFLVSLAGCSDDKMQPITLMYEEDTSLKLYLGGEGKYNFPLRGGDGSYTVKSSNDKIVTAEMQSSIDLLITVKDLGEAIVTITDNSQNILVLNIQVDYSTETIVIRELDVTIVGDDLTEDEKKAIREKQLARIPVKVGGGYQFINMEYESDPYSWKGKAIIYTDIFGSDGIETTFESIRLDSRPIIPATSSGGYEMIIENEKRLFLFGNYNPSYLSIQSVILRTSPVEKTTSALIEDVTSIVQIEYPKAELVYTAQTISTYFLD